MTCRMSTTGSEQWVTVETPKKYASDWTLRSLVSGRMCARPRKGLKPIAFPHFLENFEGREAPILEPGLGLGMVHARLDVEISILLADILGDPDLCRARQVVPRADPPSPAPVPLMDRWVADYELDRLIQVLI